MSCKGACLASVGADQPAEVVDDAPKHLVLSFFCKAFYICRTMYLPGNLLIIWNCLNMSIETFLSM